MTPAATSRPAPLTRALFVLGLTLACAGPAAAVVSDDLNWARARSPIRLYSPLVIDRMGSLTIEPGVEVLFAPNAKLVVQGTLLAFGTTSQPIRFRPLNAGERWGGVVIESGDALLQAVDVRGALTGVEAAGGSTTIVDCLIEDCEDAAIRVRSGARLAAVNSRLRSCPIGMEAEDGGIASLRRCEIAHASATGLLVQPGASVTAETCVIHDDLVGIDVARAGDLAIGRPDPAGLQGGGCVLSCNGTDVVNRDAVELPAHGNFWTSASLIDGPVDASEPLVAVPDHLGAFDRLFVGKDGGAPSFGWESIADCADHVIVSSGSPEAAFAEAGPASESRLVFYRMLTSMD